LPLLFNILLKSFLGQLGKKEIEGIQTGNEDVKLLFFADDMTLYLEALNTLLKTY
jgi:hypothetical protein